MFTQITEHLAYLDMPCNIGMYMDGNQVYLVDAGLDARTGRKVYEELKRYQLQPKGLILTHAHADHCGGAAELKRIDPRIQVYASEADYPVIRAPEYEPYYLYGAAPLRDLCNKFLQAEPVRVDQIPQTISQYFLTFSAVSAYLSYLVAEKVADIAIREGMLFFTSR